MEHLDTATEDFHKNSTSNAVLVVAKILKNQVKKNGSKNTLAYQKKAKY
jgi:hypothetical protein